MLTILLFQAYLLSRYRNNQNSDLNKESCKEKGSSSRKKKHETSIVPLSLSDQGWWSWWGYYWGWPSTSWFVKEKADSDSNSHALECSYNHNNNCLQNDKKCVLNSEEPNNLSISSPMPITSSSSQELSNQQQGNINMSLEDKFKAAVKVIHSLPKDGPYQPSNGIKLKFYGLFKQAVEGPCNVSKPAFWDVIGKYKWEAWNDLGQLSKEDAMIRYIESLKDIVETMSWDGNVQDFLNTIGPFYEFVNLQGSEMNHVKETIDRLTSSCSSSGSCSSNSSTSSIVPSPINSCPNSPLKNLNDSTSATTPIENERVEVQVESRTATYENSHGQTNGDQTNGYHSSSEHSLHPFPPPTPQHTYSRKNSMAAQAQSANSDETINEEEEGRNNEVIGVTFSTRNFVVTCQEDLEIDPEAPEIRISTMETCNTLSGTESEKYYSGDSEPDLDDKFGENSFSDSTKKTIFEQNQNPSFDHANSSLLVTTRSTAALPQSSIASCSKSSSNKTVVSFSNPSNSNTTITRNRKSSPKQNGGVGVGLNGLISSGELVLSSTVERLNRDVDHIVARLRILEAAYASSVSNDGNGTEVGRRSRRRPFFGGLSYSAIAFLLVWPFAVSFLLKLMSWWWARRKRILALAKRSLR